MAEIHQIVDLIITELNNRDRIISELNFYRDTMTNEEKIKGNMEWTNNG